MNLHPSTPITEPKASKPSNSFTQKAQTWDRPKHETTQNWANENLKTRQYKHANDQGS